MQSTSAQGWLSTCCMLAQCHSVCPAGLAPWWIRACQIGHTQPAGIMMVQLGTAFLSFGACLLIRIGQEAAACSATYSMSYCYRVHARGNASSTLLSGGGCALHAELLKAASAFSNGHVVICRGASGPPEVNTQQCRPSALSWQTLTTAQCDALSSWSHCTMSARQRTSGGMATHVPARCRTDSFRCWR